jgi:uncharacterized membrane protein YfcA
MSVEATLIIAVVGLLGGAINAVAGGATLLTFPVLMSFGLSPIVANASSSVALTPGHLFGVLSEYRQLPARPNGILLSVVIMIVGGLIGAGLLSITTDRLFNIIVPLLIGSATLIFAFGKQIQFWLNGSATAHVDHPLKRLVFLFPVSVYVGYFGAGAGVVMMALFTVTTNWTLRGANAVKNLLGAASNWAAIAIFANSGLIAWPETLTMLVGAAFGGLLGGRILRIVNVNTIRTVVIVAGAVLTSVYAVKYWT